MLLLSGCGGGTGNGSTSDGTDPAVTTTGNVALLLTDAPTDDFDEVNVTITTIELIDSEDNAVEIFSGERTVNLLDVQDVSELYTLDSAPVGVYQSIRLGVAGIELVRFDESSGEIAEVIEPRLPSGMIKLNPRRGFEVEADETLVVEVDLDARRSIHIVKAGNSGMYVFRPVVFVKVHDGIVKSRFTRVEGTIDDVDESAQTFRLCGEFDQDDETADDPGCLLVGVGDTTSIFTTAGAATFADIVAGDTATVFGRLQRGEDPILEARLVYLGDAQELTRVRGVVSSGYDADSGTFEVEVGRSLSFEAGAVITVDLLDGVRILSRGGDEPAPEEITAGSGIWILGVVAGDSDDQLSALAIFLADRNKDAAMLSGTVAGIDVDAGTFELQPSTAGNISADTLICIDSATNLYLISGSSSSRIGLDQLPAGGSADVYGHQASSGCFKAETVLAFTVEE